MRVLLRTLIFAGLLLFLAASVVAAETISIGPIKNMNRDDVSSLTAECETSKDGRQMTCDFVQVTVSLAKKPEDAVAEVEKHMKEIGTGTKELNEAQKSMCGPDGLSQTFAQGAKMPDLAANLRQFLSVQLDRLNRFCERPTWETYRAVFWHMLEKETKTCRIWTNPWRETFTKALGGKWVSNRGPTGVCGLVVVSTLDSRPLDPKKPDSILRLWTYETQKIVTNKEIGGPFCQRDEAKVVYSWQAKEFGRSCEFIEFGF